MKRIPPATQHEQATVSTWKPRGFRLMDEAPLKPAPVRWLVRGGKPVTPVGKQLLREAEKRLC